MNVEKWVKSLDGLRDWNAKHRELDALLRDGGERETLVEIARLCGAASREKFVRRSMHERVIEMFALMPARENVLALRELFRDLPPIEASSPPRWGEKRARYLASILAAAQAPADLLELGEWARGEIERRELVACCIGELVVRERLDGLPNGPAREIWRAHPLGAMPLELLPIERDFPAFLPQYGVGNRTSSYAYRRAKSSEIAGVTRQVWPTNHDENELQSALANWAQESNGVLASGVWNWFDVVKPNEFGLGILRILSCDATNDVAAFARVKAKVALNALFSGASGGAYNSGEYGAWGRLQTWRSAAALVGLEPQSSIAQITELADKCAWFDFAAQSEWFYEIMRDVGLACLRPDGRSVAVLAGTDTD